MLSIIIQCKLNMNNFFKNIIFCDLHKGVYICVPWPWRLSPSAPCPLYLRPLEALVLEVQPLVSSSLQPRKCVITVLYVMNGLC